MTAGGADGPADGSGALAGSCLCGAIRYEVEGGLGPIGHCHCRTCRKAHAAAFATTSRVARARFRWSSGEALVASFESSPGKRRFFCPRCGSHLIAAWKDAPTVIVRVGSLDSDPGQRPAVHIWASQKAPWHEITDALPQFAESASSAAATPNARGAIHHVDLTARDVGRSTDFYDRVLPLLGFRRGANVPEGPIWAGDRLEIGLQPARSPGDHDRYVPGLHHLALWAPSRAAVDAAHERLCALGVPVLDAPADYPQYAPGYYAVFFADPDGIKLEYVFTPRWPSGGEA